MLFDNQEDGFLFNSNPGINYGKIHLSSVSLLSIEKPLPYFDSLLSMLKTTIEQYKNKGLIYDEEINFLNEDLEINIPIYKKFNPICSFYNRESW
jgi:hypothetical protein